MRPAATAGYSCRRRGVRAAEEQAAEQAAEKAAGEQAAEKAAGEQAAGPLLPDAAPAAPIGAPLMAAVPRVGVTAVAAGAAGLSGEANDQDEDAEEQ